MLWLLVFLLVFILRQWALLLSETLDFTWIQEPEFLTIECFITHRTGYEMFRLMNSICKNNERVVDALTCISVQCKNKLTIQRRKRTLWTATPVILNHMLSLVVVVVVHSSFSTSCGYSFDEIKSNQDIHEIFT